MTCEDCVEVPGPITASIRGGLMDLGVPSQFVGEVAFELARGNVERSTVTALAEWGHRHPEGDALLGDSVGWAIQAAASGPEPLQVMNLQLRSAVVRWARREGAAHRTIAGMARIALAEGIRKAGGKVLRRINAAVKSGAITEAMAASAREAPVGHTCARSALPDLIFAALGVTEEEALLNAFTMLEDQARTFLNGELDERLRQVAFTLGIPHQTVRDEWADRTKDRTDAAVLVLGGLIFGLAVDRLRDPEGDIMPGGEQSVSGVVPPVIISEVLDAAGGAPVTAGEDGLRVAYNRQTGTITDPSDGSNLPGGLWTGADTSRIIVGLVGGALGRPVVWHPLQRWEWAYWGTPLNRFDPHYFLNGKVFTSDGQRLTDTAIVDDGVVWIPNVGQKQWYPGDHERCSCGWVTVDSELALAEVA